MAVKDDKTDTTKTTTTPELTDEERSRQAMGKGPVSEGGTGGGNDGVAVVPEAGGDPDSVQRIVKHLPQYLQDRIGGITPEEVAAERAAYGEAVNAARNPQGPRATDGASDEEMAARTGQPIGDGKSTGAPSADDPGSGLREGKLTAGDDTTGRGSAAAKRATAAAGAGDSGVSQVRGRSTAPANKVNTQAQGTTNEEK